MKILQINKFHFPKGGADVHYLELSRLLESEGHTVMNFSAKHPANLPSTYEQYFAPYQNVEQTQISLRHLLTPLRFFYNRQAARQLKKLLEKERPDIAHIHNIYHHLSPSILVVLKKYRIPTIITVHDHKLVCPNYGRFAHGQICEHSSGGRVWPCIIKKCVKNSYLASLTCGLENFLHRNLGWYRKNIDLAITPSHYLKNQLIAGHAGLKHIEVLPNFIDEKKWSPRKDTVKKQRFIYVGRLSEEKGCDLLLSAWKNRTSHQDRLLIIGQGPEKNMLKNFVEKNKLSQSVEFLGQKDTETIAEKISQSLAVILPSRCPENWPQAGLEAFSQKTAVIAGSHGGLPEMITTERGYLFTEDSVRQLTAIIDHVSQNKPEAIDKGLCGQVWLKAKATWPDYYRKLHEIYKKAIVDS